MALVRRGHLNGSHQNMALVASNASANYKYKCSSTFDHRQPTAMSHYLFHNHPFSEVYSSNFQNDTQSSSKRRKISTCSSEIISIPSQNEHPYNIQRTSLVCNASAVVPATSSSKHDLLTSEDLNMSFMTRDEIEQSSPSRKDGISPLQETQLRYSYCAFLHHLGFRLDLPQTTIGTAMVLCHRFFFRRSHACHDRYVIATAVLFLASKSEETPRPLNDVLKVSAEIIHQQNFSVLSYMLPFGWFERYREQIIDAEQLILTTLNFELTVHHPYESLTSTLQKLGFPSVLLNLALHLVTQGAQELTVASVQASTYSRWSCIPCFKVSKHEPRFSSQCLERILRATLCPQRCCSPTDGTLLKDIPQKHQWSHLEARIKMGHPHAAAYSEENSPCFVFFEWSRASIHHNMLGMRTPPWRLYI